MTEITPIPSILSEKPSRNQKEERRIQKEKKPHIMRVRKRSGSLEPVDVTKIVERVSSLCQGLLQVDPLRVSTKAISGLYDGATTTELDGLCVRTASLLIGEEPEYSQLASRLLSAYIEEEVRCPKNSYFYGFHFPWLSTQTYFQKGL